MSSFPLGISSMKLKVSTFEQVIASASLGGNSIKIAEQNILSALQSDVTINPSMAVTYDNTAFPSSNIVVAGTPYVPVPPPPKLILLANGVTIKYVANPADVPTSTAKFIQADPRGTGMEWFAVVRDSSKMAIKNYAKGIISPLRNALNFDGVNDYVNLDIPAWTYSTQFRTTMTIECWFKTTDTNDQKPSANFVSRWITGGYDAQFMFFMNSSGQVGFNAHGVAYVLSPLAYKDTLWHHAAVTFNSVNSELILYIDGSIVNTTSSAGTSNLLDNNSTIKLVIGSDDAAVIFSGNTDRQFSGSIADVRIWNVVRSASDIRNNYLTQLNGNESGLVFYAKLNQGIAGGDNHGVTTAENNMSSGGTTGTLGDFTLSGTTSNWVSGPPLPVMPLDPLNNSIPFNNIVTTLMTDMSSMFDGASAFNQDISSWDTSNVTNMSAMFSGATAFNQNISQWNVGLVLEYADFYTNSGLQLSYVPSKFRPALLGLSTTNNITIEYTGLSTDVADSTARFIQADPRGTGMEWFAVVKDSMKESIRNYARQISNNAFIPPGESSPVPFNNIVTTLMNDMSGLFSDANSFNENIRSWDTSNVTNMSSMFDDAFAFNQPINSWDTSKVTNMTYMFYYAYAFNQNIGNWNTSSVTDMNSMFNNAIAFNGFIGTWNTTSVTNMVNMFIGASMFNQNVSGWIVDNVEYYENFYTNYGLDNNSELLNIPEKFRPSSINDTFDEVEESIAID
jgi:surface protein